MTTTNTPTTKTSTTVRSIGTKTTTTAAVAPDKTVRATDNLTFNAGLLIMGIVGVAPIAVLGLTGWTVLSCITTTIIGSLILSNL